MTISKNSVDLHYCIFIVELIFAWTNKRTATQSKTEPVLMNMSFIALNIFSRECTNSFYFVCTC